MTKIADISKTIYNCGYTQACQNHRCFWKQRDCYGLAPFFYEDENGGSAAVNKEVREKYGETYFPEHKVSLGTNCMHVICKDRIDD